MFQALDNRLYPSKLSSFEVLSFSRKAPLNSEITANKYYLFKSDITKSPLVTTSEGKEEESQNFKILIHK